MKARPAAILLVTMSVVGLTSAVAAPGETAARLTVSTLPGAWEAVYYHLEEGPSHPVRGRIFFTQDEWQVLFFVMDGDQPRRASGEGGRYTFDGEHLTFEHLFHFSTGEEMPGLPASPLEMTAREGEGPHEPTRVGMTEEHLTLHFPSGNVMAFRRSSMP